MRAARPLAVAALAGLLGVAAGGAAAQTLTDTLILAYRTSGLLEQNRAVLRAADEDVALAVARLRPTVGYVAQAAQNRDQFGSLDSSSLALSLDWLLFDFGRSRLAVDAQKEAVLAAREALQQVEQQVLLRGAAAHFEVRRQLALVALRDNNVGVLSQQYQAAQDRFEVGEVTRTDVSIAEARLAAARSALAAAQGALAQAREEYRAVTDRYPDTPAPPPPPPEIPDSQAEAEAVAVRQHPLIDQVQHEVAAAEIRIEAARRNILPSLTAQAEASLDQDGEDRQTFGLRMTGPIYQGGAIPAQTRQAQARRDQARASLYTTVQDVVQDVGNAWANLRVAFASLDASDRQVSAAQLALRGAQEELQVGSRTVLDVLDREQELLDARTTLVSAQIDRDFAVYQLLTAMGLMTVEHLNLGIATYDPRAYYNAVKGAPLGTTVTSPQGARLDNVLERLGR